MDSGTVAHAVRVQPFAAQRRLRNFGTCAVFSKQVPHTEPREALTAVITEQRSIGGDVTSWFPEPGPQDFCGLRPQGTPALLATLAVEPNLRKCFQLQGAKQEYTDFLHSGAGLEHGG